MSPQKILRGLEGLIGIRNFPKYDYTLTPEGNHILRAGGFQVGSILATDEFKQSQGRFPGWLDDDQYSITEKFDYSTRRDLRDSPPRRNSGLYPSSHYERDFKEVLRMCQETGIAPDFIMGIAIIGHDGIEDHGPVDSFLSDWKAAIRAGRYDEAREIAQQLENSRLGKKNDIEEQLVSYIPGSARPGKRRALEDQIRMGVQLIYTLTRFSDTNPYAFSVGDQFTKLRHGDMSHEHPDITFRRIPVKVADRNMNMEETGPLVPPATLRVIYNAFNDPLIGPILREQFGSVSHTARDMSAAEMTKMAFESMYPLHYGNETFNALGPQIIGTLNNRTPELMRLAMYANREMAAATLGLIDKALAFYEKFPEVQKAKPRIERDIKEFLRGDYYDKITYPGPAIDWMGRDPWEREELRQLDENPNERTRNYEALRHLRIVTERLGRYYEPGKDQPILRDDFRNYDPTRHRLFTLKNVSSIRDFVKYETLVNRERNKYFGEKGPRKGLSFLSFLS